MKSLQESEERYRNLANSLPEIVFESSINGKVIFANKNGFEKTGYTEKDFEKGIEIFNLIAPQDRQKAIEHFKKTINNQPSSDNEFTVIRKDGTTFPAIIITSVIGVNNHPVGLRGIVIDITEQKKMENALRKSQKKYRDLIETANDFVWEIDPQGRYTYCSPQMGKLWGINPAEMIGKTPFDMMPPADKEKALSAFMTTINSPKPISGMQTTSYDCKGRLIFLEINGVPFFDNKGKLRGFRGITRDITERKKTELSLKESEARLRVYLESTPAAVFVANPDGKYIYVNEAACNLLGYSKDELLNMRIPDILCIDSLNQGLEKFREVKETGRSRSDTCLRRKDGCFVFVILTATKLPDGNLIANCEDITDRRELEKQLQVKERLATIGSTAGMVGHDIRNPLQAIMSDTYLLKEELTAMPESKTKEGVNESIDNIEKSVVYINKIVQDLQDYSRSIIPEYSEVKLSDVVINIFDIVSLPNTIKLSINIKDAEKIRTDPMLLQRAITNLVTNAIQAMPDGGKLEINGQQKNNQVVITVADTGVGIPDEIKPKLFTPMMTTKAKGQGFGLAVTKRLIEALNGTISLESEVNKGTKFIVQLPINP